MMRYSEKTGDRNLSHFTLIAEANIDRKRGDDGLGGYPDCDVFDSDGGMDGGMDMDLCEADDPENEWAAMADALQRPNLSRIRAREFRILLGPDGEQHEVEIVGSYSAD